MTELPKPFYDEDGITIYCGADRVILPYHGPTKRLQADTGAYRQSDSKWRSSSQLEGRCDCRTKRQVKGVAKVPAGTLCNMWRDKSREASHRREHGEQLAREHQVCLSKMPHGRGWAT